MNELADFHADGRIEPPGIFHSLDKQFGVVSVQGLDWACIATHHRDAQDLVDGKTHTDNRGRRSEHARRSGSVMVEKADVSLICLLVTIGQDTSASHADSGNREKDRQDLVTNFNIIKEGHIVSQN